MTARKRARPRRGGTTGAQRQEAQRQRAAERQQLETKDMMASYLSMAEASALSGVDRYRIGSVVRRAGVPVFKSPTDARKRFIKREDIGRLTGFTPAEPDDGGAEAAE